MAQDHLHQASFTGGEISHNAHWRSDVQIYASALALSRNFVPSVKGPNVKRAGTVLVDIILENDSGRMVPFQRGTEQGYCLVFHAGNFRPYDASRYIPLDIEVEGIWEEGDINSLYWWRSADVMLLAEGQGKKRTQVIQHYGPLSWEVKDYKYNDGPWRNSPQGITLTSAALTGEVWITASDAVFSELQVGSLIRWFQPKSGSTYGRWLIKEEEVEIGDRRISNERIYEAVTAGTTGSFAPIHEEGVSSDGLLDWKFIHDGAVTLEILEVVADNSTQTQAPPIDEPRGTFSFPFFEKFGQFNFEFDDLDIIAPDDENYDNVASDPSTLKRRARVRILGELPSLSTDIWQEQAFSDYRGYPRLGIFYQSRLWLFNTPTSPDGWWSSQSFNFDAHGAGFKPGLGFGLTVDSDAISGSAADGTIDPITDVMVGDELYIGSMGGFRKLLGPRNTEILVPGGTFVRYLHTPGVRTNVRSARARKSFICVQPDGRGAFGLYDNGEESDQGALADHLFEDSPLKTLDFVQKEKLVWAHTEDGRLLSAVIDDENKVLGWQSHLLGGKDPVVKSLTVMRRPDGLQDVWLLVDRAAKGRRRRTVEVLTQPYRRGRTIPEMIYLDSALYYDTAIENTVTDDEVAPSLAACLQAQRGKISDFHTTTNPKTVSKVTGLENFHNEQLRVIGDGLDLGFHTVNGGTIFLKRPSKQIVVGLPYTARMITLPYDLAMSGERVRGANRSMSSLTMGLVDTIGGIVGRLGYKRDEYQKLAEIRDGDLDTKVPPLINGSDRNYDFSGFEEFENDDDFVTGFTNDDDVPTLQIDIIHEEPYPCTITLIEGKVHAND